MHTGYRCSTDRSRRSDRSRTTGKCGFSRPYGSSGSTALAVGGGGRLRTVSSARTFASSSFLARFFLHSLSSIHYLPTPPESARGITSPSLAQKTTSKTSQQHSHHALYDPPLHLHPPSPFPNFSFTSLRWQLHPKSTGSCHLPRRRRLRQRAVRRALYWPARRGGSCVWLISGETVSWGPASLVSDGSGWSWRYCEKIRSQGVVLRKRVLQEIGLSNKS